MWYVAAFLHPDSRLESFSGFCDRINKDHDGKYEEKHNAKVISAVDNMIEMFLPKDVNKTETS